MVVQLVILVVDTCYALSPFVDPDINVDAFIHVGCESFEFATHVGVFFFSEMVVSPCHEELFVYIEEHLDDHEELFCPVVILDDYGGYGTNCDDGCP